MTANRSVMGTRFVTQWIGILLAGWLALGGMVSTSLAAGDWFVRIDGDDGAAGTSWGEAFATVSNALAHASDTQVIVVSNGVYELTAQLDINNAVTLRSVNGAAVTTLRRDGTATHRVIQMAHAGAVVEGFTIANGQAPGNPSSGGGIHMTGGTVRDCIITNNLASARQTRGGGVWMSGGTLEDCVIVDNQALGGDGHGYGAAVMASGGALIQRCRIYGNHVRGTYSSARGAVYLGSGNNILRNCLIYGNEAHISQRPTPSFLCIAGVYSDGTGNRVEYNTIVGNVSLYGVGVGLYMHRGHAVNNIVYFNHTEFGGDYRTLHRNAYATPDRADTSISYSCAYPLVEGDGNTAADPLFADWQNGDFRLLPGSPALDTADPMAGVTTDYYGVERDRDGNGDGMGAPDMGAIEAEAADAGPLRCALVAAVNEAVGSAEFTYTAHVAGSNTTGLIYAWDFENNGTVDATGATAAYTFGVGWHDVKLTVSNAVNDSVTLVREVDARIAPTVVYVAEGADHVFPFDSPADAATNVQAAVNAALATGTAVSEVRVADGHYLLERPLIVDKGIVLRSKNGADVTTLDAQEASNRRVMELYHGAADAAVDGFTLTGGRVPTLSYGAGINMFDGTLLNCVITNNIASGRSATQGGGVRMFGGVLRGCTIVDNRSSGGDGGGAGGGVWASGGGALIDRCRIVGNRATASTSQTAYGGGVYLTGNAILRNSIVTGNYVNNNPSTHRGAGVYVNHADSRVENCTIVDNYIDAGDSAGVYQNNGTVVNTILWRNYMVGLEDSLADHRNHVVANGSMTHCISHPLPDGTGNIDSDPMFVDRAAGDYRLSLGSPAIDAGTSLAAVTNDFAGVARPLDGNDDGTPMHDIGAFEFDPAEIDTLMCSFSAEPSQGVDSIDAVFTAFVAGPGSGNVKYYWDFNNDGSFEIEGVDKAVVTNTYGIGIYSVKLMVSNLVEQTGAMLLEENYIQVIPSTVYVATDGLHVPPFHTPEHAATNIHDALSVVASGGQILIGAGVYGIEEQIALTRPLTVRGIEGPEATIIEHTTGSTRVFRLSDPDALIEGLTIRGGSVGNIEYGGGVYVAAGTVRACIVTGNNAGGRFSEGGGIYLTAGGLVENSLIVGNRDSGGDRSQGGGIRMTGGIVRNCTITGNSANREGGGIYRTGGVVTNSIIVNNFAVNGIGNHNVDGQTSAFAYSCSPDLIDGVDGNITADPVFRDPGEDHGLNHVRGDYRLNYALSPCRNAGINQPWMLTAVDLAGLPRILMGNVDMGCYETPPPRGSLIKVR